MRPKPGWQPAGLDTGPRYDEDACTLSVVLPCRNEATTVAACVRQAAIGISRLGVSGEVLVVDNNSSDDSATLARDAGARVILVDRRGYGAALRAGIRSARGSFIVIADSDGSYELTNLGIFWDRLSCGDDLVVGNRFKGGVGEGAMPFWHRYVGNPVLSFCGRVLFPTTVRDFHCGIRAFRRAPISLLPLCADGMEFATELIVRSLRAGLTVSEVPTPLFVSRRAGRSHLRPIRDGLRHMRLMAVLSVSTRTPPRTKRRHDS